MIRAVFFDLDGTLIDTEKFWIEATWNVLTDHYHLSVPYATIESIVLGHAWADIYANLCQLFPEQTWHLNELEDLVETAYRNLTSKGVPAITSSVTALKNLAQQNILIAIVSGSPRKMIAEAIEKLDIKKEVSFYLGSEDYAPGKPAPICYQKAAELSQIPLEDCLVIEDSAAGITAATVAGIRSIAITAVNTPDNAAEAIMATSDLTTVNFAEL